jgi:diguanylate cyclase (GGDEF)-like protein
MMAEFIRNLPLRHKLNGLVVIVTATILLFVSLAYYIHQQQVIEQQANVELTTLGQIYAQSCTAALAFDDNTGAKKLLQSIKVKKNILGAAILRPDGTVFAEYLTVATAADLMKNLEQHSGEHQATRYYNNNDIFQLCTPMILDNENMGHLVLLANFHDVRALQKNFLVFLGLLFGIAVLLSWLISIWLQRHLMAPIDSLMDTMDLVSRNNDFSLRATTTTSDELGQLCQQFNIMLQRIDNQDTLLKTQKEGLNFLATHDPLTNLPNRNLFNDRLQEGVARARRNHSGLAVMFIDLDRFKNINDTLGHDAGDELLKEVAHRIKDTVREIDTVARFGGDEFVVMVTDTAPENLTRVADKLQQAIRQPIELHQCKVVITPSIGISSFPQHGDTPEQLIKYADVAMYHAKNNGRDGYHRYSSDMATKINERFNMENRLQVALESNELYLHYQPQYDLRTQTICGCEALLRWQTGGEQISPVAFIPVAEESGLIVPIGLWVLNQACQQAKQWQLSGYPIMPVAVNVSARQFFAAGLIDEVEKALIKASLPAQWLEIEITESMVMNDIDKAIAIMENLSAMGVGLALDDFGTGYSSLAYLKRFPLNKIKIDRSFVRDLLIDADDSAITKAVISMSLAMNFKVIAEGIETQAQFDFLLELNCDQGQGFLMSKPISPEELTALLASHHTPSCA